MKVAPPSDLRLQCPECGVPVDALELVDDRSIRLDPCGHECTPEALGLYPAKDVRGARIASRLGPDA